jgi:hypothetical protein
VDLIGREPLAERSRELLAQLLRGARDDRRERQAVKGSE